MDVLVLGVGLLTFDLLLIARYGREGQCDGRNRCVMFWVDRSAPGASARGLLAGAICRDTSSRDGGKRRASPIKD
jgi:hypothetical protein